MHPKSATAPHFFTTFVVQFHLMTYHSRVVQIGILPMGGSHPVRVQSMTNTPTLDTDATVAQCIRLIEAGSELVRITARGPAEARRLGVIREILRSRGYLQPVIADIHYSAEAALIAARLVEKVRINPGNYTDPRRERKSEWTDMEYNEELDFIASQLAPLLEVCTQHGTAIRIGVNHGSLSRRIVSRYGDTPEGMVQSALEYTRICHKLGFHNLVLSLKSSNVRVMVHAYLLLAGCLTAEGLNYPLHLGVTEAGNGDDGRLKSAAGTGALLARGIGDTIRVSLTEAPERELPVARAIIGRYHEPVNGITRRMVRPDLVAGEEVRFPFPSIAPPAPGNPARVLVKKGEDYLLAGEDGSLEPAGYRVCSPAGLHTEGSVGKPPMLLLDEAESDGSLPDLSVLVPADPQMPLLVKGSIRWLSQIALGLFRHGLSNPLILQGAAHTNNRDELLIEAALNPGGLLTAGCGNGICLDAGDLDAQEVAALGFGLLQATRMRITRTEYISCPSCGRTLFDIEEALRRVKERTSHLRGLRIAVMGCIVNGPGEMADADYGYVGAGKGKVTLYKGRQAVRQGVPEAEAVESLAELIRSGGDWKEPGTGALRHIDTSTGSL